MTESVDPPFERVLVENDWWDGLGSGIALVGGKPHRFEVCRDVEVCHNDDGDVITTYVVTPVDDATLALEVEQFQIFVRWNERYEQGIATVATHPGHGGIDDRYDEIARLLATASATGGPSKRMTGARRWRETASRYSLDGPDYEMQWTPLPVD